MRSLLAELIRFVFRFSFARKFFFGLHRRFFFPYRLFRGVRKRYLFNNTIHFDLAIDDWIPENLYFMDAYESEELTFLENTIKPGDVVIDIGANIGLYTLFAAKLAGSTGGVIAFEPFAENFQELKRNCSLNNFSHITLEPIAISDGKKEIALSYETGEANKGMVSAYGPGGAQREISPAISLDEYLGQNPVRRLDFIKIDIEGGEYPALLGMRKTLARFSPTLLIEINFGILLSTPFSAGDIIRYLQELGYREHHFGRQGKANRVFKKVNT